MIVVVLVNKLKVFDRGLVDPPIEIENECLHLYDRSKHDKLSTTTDGQIEYKTYIRSTSGAY